MSYNDDNTATTTSATTTTTTTNMILPSNSLSYILNAPFFNENTLNMNFTIDFNLGEV